MNRIIKFRGKSLDTHTWLFGALFPNGSKKAYIAQYGLPLSLERVAPETVGQYTGLKDKNGAEIYEGDILELDFQSRKCIDYVEFRDGRFVSVDSERPYKADGLYLWLANAKVIGNIHDNPELLKGGENGRDSRNDA